MTVMLTATLIANMNNATSGIDVGIDVGIPAGFRALPAANEPDFTKHGSSILTKTSHPNRLLALQFTPQSDQNPALVTLQVGLFTALNRAESQQVDLSRLGLQPYIQKRVAEKDILYAVLVGPLSQNSEYPATIDLLKANNIRYFHRPFSG
jgi:cell division septation protein DedD